MKKEDLRIVFLGTPEFAVESLSRIVGEGYNVVGVVTMPDKIAGRGHKLIQSPVKDYALAHGLHLMQPERLKAPEFVEELRSLRANLFVVIAFRMLPGDRPRTWLCSSAAVRVQSMRHVSLNIFGAAEGSSPCNSLSCGTGVRSPATIWAMVSSVTSAPSIMRLKNSAAAEFFCTHSRKVSRIMANFTPRRRRPNISASRHVY